MAKNKESINQLPLPLPLLRTPQHMPFHRDRRLHADAVQHQPPTLNVTYPSLIVTV